MKNLVLIFSCLMAMSVMSCGDDATVNPPKDNNLSGIIAGRVVLFDEYGDSLSNHSGVAVKLVNANHSYSATTDVSGNYKLEKVISGIYTISFKKENWKEIYEENLQFVGNGTLKKDVSLHQLKRGSILFGYVKVYNQLGLQTEAKGVSVFIEGTNTTTITDSIGYWSFKGLEDGQYFIKAIKLGFETVPNISDKIDFKNDTVNGNPVYVSDPFELLENVNIGINLELLETFFVDTAEIDSAHGIWGDTHTAIKLNGTIISNSVSNNAQVTIFYGTQNVSLENNLFSSKTSISNTKEIFLGKIYKDGRTTQLPSSIREFSSGEKVFIRAYVTNPYSRIVTDPKTGEKRAVGFGPPSNVVSFTMP